jgi:hypothetical protein
LSNEAYRTTAQFEIPEAQIDKYETILDFYKKLLKDVPSFATQLDEEYTKEINGCVDCDKTKLLKIKPSKWVPKMKKEDMSV